jgi:hypothetical protein
MRCSVRLRVEGVQVAARYGDALTAARLTEELTSLA